MNGRDSHYASSLSSEGFSENRTYEYFEKVSTHFPLFTSSLSGKTIPSKGATRWWNMGVTDKGHQSATFALRGGDGNLDRKAYSSSRLLFAGVVICDSDQMFGSVTRGRFDVVVTSSSKPVRTSRSRMTDPRAPS